MNQILKNKIEANDTNINTLLKNQKFTIDYFQREYRWQDKHIQLLIEDLTTSFLKSYNPNHSRTEVAGYQSYYLGPVVFSINPDTGKKSIIDGQQRITSLTLLLIYLNHLQAESKQKVSITDLIFSEKFGEKSFNMSDENRDPCLKSLFEDGEYILNETDDETVKNMVERYFDIEQSFPDELTQEALPFFLDWLIENVILVEIIAYSDDNAYTIFETMNDRGLNLTQTEMLKGYVLSKIIDKNKRNEISELWKTEIQKLHDYDKDYDLIFFQAWFRGKYATSIRPGKAGSEDKDFELIGSRFHNWFKDNHNVIFHLNSSNDFYNFFKFQFPFYVKWFLKVWDARQYLDTSLKHVNYCNNWGIADSLQNPLFLAPIKHTDKDETIKKKIDFVARYVETFTVRRSSNFKKFGQTSIKYTMFNIVKLVRDNDLPVLSENLIKEVHKLTESWEGILDFGLHGQNRKFVKHLLSRITSYIDNLASKDTSYASYHHPNGKQFEIEHIWADKFDEHKDEFEQQNDFKKYRNYIGALLLLPNGTNQSFNSDKYEDKIEYYLRENIYAQTLNKKYYTKNPNFLNSEEIQEIGFKSHSQFKKEDILSRNNLVKRICEKIWSTEYYKVNL